MIHAAGSSIVPTVPWGTFDGDEVTTTEGGRGERIPIDDSHSTAWIAVLELFDCQLQGLTSLGRGKTGSLTDNRYGG